MRSPGKTTSADLSQSDFCRIFGFNDYLPLENSTRERISQFNFNYEVLSDSEAFVLSSLVSGRIDSGFTRVGEHRELVWADAWSEVKQRFMSSNLSIDELIPKFVGATGLLRHNGQFIRPKDSRFELSFFFVLRDWLFRHYLSSYDSVLELGAGSGFNVIEFSKIFPKKRVIGADWSESSVDILNIYAASTGAQVEGMRFNFFYPSDDLRISRNTAVMTFCAFEQIGSRFDAILNFLLDERPARVVQVEPVLELYNASDPFDQLAIRYHTCRGYLEGYYPALRKFESDRKIRILHAKRTGFGSLFNECYNIIVWEPI